MLMICDVTLPAVIVAWVFGNFCALDLVRPFHHLDAAVSGE